MAVVPLVLGGDTASRYTRSRLFTTLKLGGLQLSTATARTEARLGGGDGRVPAGLEPGQARVGAPHGVRSCVRHRGEAGDLLLGVPDGQEPARGLLAVARAHTTGPLTWESPLGPSLHFTSLQPGTTKCMTLQNEEVETVDS